MNRIIIIGCGGAGKSTLARQLGEKLNIPVIHLDKLFWKPGWVESDRAEFDARLMQEYKKPRWIIDGNYNRTMAQRASKADTIIYLDFSRFACFRGIAKRILMTYGTVRPDMAEGCPEKIDFEFFQWVWSYNKRWREKNYKLLNECTHAQTIVLKNRRMVKKFLNSL